jgi:hypothetical protein
LVVVSVARSLPGALWIVALKPIEAGGEIRVNYEAEGRAGQYCAPFPAQQRPRCDR